MHSGPSHNDAKKEMVERAVSNLYNISPRTTHPMTTVLLMKAHNPMPMQDLLLVDRTQLEESVDLDEAPEAHPMATNQAFFSNRCSRLIR